MSTDLVKYEPNAPVKNAGTLSGLLEREDVQGKMAAIVPKHLTPERLAKMALIATSRQPKLLECTQGSLLRAVMTSGELGLDCSGTTGRAYLVPFRNNKTGCTEATFIAGYLGLVDLARNSGDLRSIRAEVVYRQDDFELEKGLDEKLVHKPDLNHDFEDKDIVGAYMIARLADGGHHFHYMSRREIEKIRARSRAKDAGPWVTDYAAMCKKTVIRGGVKFLPLSVETQQNIAKMDDAEFDERILRPEPQRAVFNMDDIKPGDPATHQAVDQPAPPMEAHPVPKAAELAWELFNDKCNGLDLSEDMRNACEDALLAACEVHGWGEIKTKKAGDAAATWVGESMEAFIESQR